MLPDVQSQIKTSWVSDKVKELILQRLFTTLLAEKMESLHILTEGFIHVRSNENSCIYVDAEKV